MKKENYDQMNKFENEYWWHVGRRFILTRLIRKYAAFGKNDLSIIDIGCGTGGNYKFLENFGNVIGADNSPFATSYCGEKGKSVKLISGDVLPFPDDSFDLVAIFDVLEHIENDNGMLDECRRILKKGGKLVATVPAYQSIWSSHDEILGHYRRYSRKELSERIEKAGFNTIKASYCITFMFPVIFIFRMAKKIFFKKKQSDSAYFLLPKAINDLFIVILYLEAHLVKKMNMPFGCSIVIVSEKKVS